MVITGGYLRHPRTGSSGDEMPSRPFEFDKSQSLVTELAGLGGQVGLVDQDFHLHYHYQGDDQASSRTEWGPCAACMRDVRKQTGKGLL